MFFCTFAIELTIGFKGKLVIKMRAPKTTDIINNGVFKAHFVTPLWMTLDFAVGTGWGELPWTQ